MGDFMEYIAFYISMAAILATFAICLRLKKFRLSNAVIGIATIGYSLVYEVTLGGYFGLYHYISPKVSLLYIVIGALFIYPFLNMLYTLFLPTNKKWLLVYTLSWIAAMLLFEYITLLTRTVVFTGWRPIPWSIVTYVVTYAWIYFFYRVLERKCG